MDSIPEIHTLPTGYDPGVIVNYMNQATVSEFQINSNKTELLLFRDKEDLAFPLPGQVLLMKDHIIEVTMAKKLYTKQGWKDVMIKIVYKRFSDQV